MKKSLVIILGILILVIAGVRYLTYPQNEFASEVEGTFPVTTKEEARRQEHYEDDLRALLLEFQKAPSSDRVTTASATRQKVLALVVPASYKDVHLDVVLALTAIADGEGSARYDKSLASVDWLKDLAIQE